MTTPPDRRAKGPAGDDEAGIEAGVEAESEEAAVIRAEIEAKDAERSVFFSDAVVAIAITLLALELPVPAGVHGMTNGQLWHELAKNEPDYLSFLISFLVIGNHWFVHRGVFRYARRVNRRVNVLNLCWLLTMILTPAAARLLAGDGAFGLRFGGYALVQAIAVTCLLLIRRQLIRDDLMIANAPEKAWQPEYADGIIIAALFVISIPVGFVTEWAYACWGAVPVLTRGLRLLPPSVRDRLR
ncbi:MAG TPA: TMEM175 family protein [Trebonia sp.]|nr:TMEM175 family protein [Trebonia sp.]